MELSFKLEGFEGPMDLLLLLIRKHKLNIYDIPIVELVEQYLSCVRQMQEADMDVASDFLEMAARLVYIKTVSLLPVHEEADELRKELTGELLEYRDCQTMAGKLAETANGFNEYVRAPQEPEVNHTYQLLHEPEELLRAYKTVLGKGKRRLPPPVDSFTEIVAKRIVSVSEKIDAILARMRSAGTQTFMELMSTSESRSDMVATFLALLELIRDKKINTSGSGMGLIVAQRRN